MSEQPSSGRGWRARRKADAAEQIPWRKRHASVRARRRGEGFVPRKIEPVTLPQLRVVSPHRRAFSFDSRGRVQVDVRDLMEQAISALRNSPYSLEEVRARGGPHPQTLIRWLEKRETIKPQLQTVVALMEAIEWEVAFQPRSRA
jgi:hypothetical protein